MRFLYVLSVASISTDSNKPLKPVASAADFLDCSWRRALKSDFHVNSSTQRASNFHASSSCSKASFLTDWNEESMETLAPWASSLKQKWSLQLWSLSERSKLLWEPEIFCMILGRSNMKSAKMVSQISRYTGLPRSLTTATFHIQPTCQAQQSLEVKVES